MSADWDLLIESHFDNKKNNTLKVLTEAVREVMAETPDLRTPLNERLGAPSSTGYDGIPEISLTEVGWNKLES